MTSTAQDAATAARQTRDRKISTAFYACLNDSQAVHDFMPEHPSDLTSAHIKVLLIAANSMEVNGKELARLIAQRDGIPLVATVEDGISIGDGE